MFTTRHVSTFSLFVTLGLCATAFAQPPGPKVDYTFFIATGAVHPGSEARIAVAFKLSPGWHVNSHTPLEKFLIATELKLADEQPFTLERGVYPEHELIQVGFQDEPLAVYEAEFTVGAVVRVDASVSPGDHVMKATLRFQACDDSQCVMPRTIDLEIPVTVAAADQALTAQHENVFASLNWNEGEETATPEAVEPTAQEPPLDTFALTGANWRELAGNFTLANRTGYANTQDFMAFIDAAESGEGNVDDNPLASRSWWVVVGLILGGGFLLNLTPCVLPLIPINIAIIGAGARAGSRVRGFLLGGAYGAAIALVYGGLGLVVVLGISTAFGAINATVWFNASIAVLFVFLGLAMFDIVHIDFSKYQAKVGVRKNPRGSFFVAFVMGGVSALLAGACVAPVVIYTIVYAQDQYANGMTLALLLPFLLGVGMALPWPFAGAGMSFLPKPGAWMTRVKQVFGVFIIGFAAYYGYQAYGIFSDKYLVDPEAVAASVLAADEDGWVTSLEEGLAQAKAAGKPVLIDFWATWCKNCLVMNKTVLKDQAVLDRLENYVKIKYQAQDASVSPVKDVWEHYELVGLPTYLILQPK